MDKYIRLLLPDQVNLLSTLRPSVGSADFPIYTLLKFDCHLLRLSSKIRATTRTFSIQGPFACNASLNIHLLHVLYYT
jgi:hypothetical protein